MKNCRKLLAFTLVLSIILCSCMTLSLAEAADKAIVRIAFVFDKTSYTAGTPIKVSYSITGGSGIYTSLNYGCYSVNDRGSEIWISGGELPTAATGTLTFTPTIGEEAYISIDGYDSEKRWFSKESDHVTITGGSNDEPLSAMLTLDKTECPVGTPITASYEITGGSGEISYIYYYCYTIDNGSSIIVAEGELTETKGSFTFTPQSGQEAYVYLFGYDSEGHKFKEKTIRARLTGSATEPDTVTVDITLGNSSYPLGSTIKANYTINGGSGSYSYIWYECFSWEGDDYITISEGKLTTASGEITFTPKYGTDGGISIYGHDSENNSFERSEYFELTDKSMKKLKISKVTAVSKRKIKVDWKKLSKKEIKKTKYIEVEVSVDKAFEDIVAVSEVSPKKTSVTIKYLPKNKKYYVRIRTVGVNDDGLLVFSAWSSVKKVKAKKK